MVFYFLLLLKSVWKNTGLCFLTFVSPCCRYYFKKASDEFECGAVFEEVSDDSSLLPTYKGKILGKVERMEWDRAAMLWNKLLQTLHTSMDVFLHTLTHTQIVCLFKLKTVGLEMLKQCCWELDKWTEWNMEKIKEGEQLIHLQDYCAEKKNHLEVKTITDCVLLDWNISMFPEEKTLETLGEWPLVKDAGFKSETDGLPDTVCASVWPWALASTSLICICRYTCLLHCIVMLILLCKDFFIAIYWRYPCPIPFILPWTSCLELGELLQFSTSVISPFWASVLKQRKLFCSFFGPSYWTLNFKNTSSKAPLLFLEI